MTKTGFNAAAHKAFNRSDTECQLAVIVLMHGISAGVYCAKLRAGNIDVLQEMLPDGRVVEVTVFRKAPREFVVTDIRVAP